MNKPSQTHESYGMVGCSRITGGESNLFGSSVRHHNCVRLRICRASVERDLKTNWFHDEGRMIEVDLSPTQFADMITAMNVGSGVPCTIRSIFVPTELNNKSMAPCPSYDQRKVFEDDFAKDIEQINSDALSALEKAQKILDAPTIKAADRKELLALLERIQRDLKHNLRFVNEQFTEAMDKTVSEAKGEVEAFVQNKIVSLGIESLRNQIEGNAPVVEGKLLSSEVKK